MSISSHALADDFISYKCIMHRHIILMDHKTTEVLDTFEITNDYELHLSGWYFDGLDLPLESSSSEYIEAKDESEGFLHSGADNFILAIIPISIYRHLW